MAKAGFDLIGELILYTVLPKNDIPTFQVVLLQAGQNLNQVFGSVE
jgi:hypothetical protein